MRILYFAHARTATGCPHEDYPLGAPLTTDQLWDRLILRHPALGALRASSRLARDNAFLPAGAQLSPGDEIAVIPPVSGG